MLKNLSSCSLLIALSIGCASNPSLQSEAAAFAHFRTVFAEAGSHSEGITLVVRNDIPIPAYLPEAQTVITRPALAGGDPRRHAQTVSSLAFNGRLHWSHVVQASGGEAAAKEAYRAFMGIALGHEIGHHLRASRGRASASPFREEMATIRIEVALLQHLIAKGHLAPEWKTRWEHFNKALLAAVPAEVLSDWKSANATTRETRFNREIHALVGRLRLPSDSPNRTGDATFVMAGYTHERLRLMREPLNLKAVLNEQGLTDEH